MLNIAVIGHEYNLYDGYFNMDLLKKLRSLGVNVTTIEMMDEQKINNMADTIDKKMFWSFGRTAVGMALNVIESKSYDGIIYLMSFGCGVDSFVQDFIERKVRNNSNIPFTVLTIDEHTGEAGLDTRIEAFIDMIRWRYSHDSNISSHG
jgi:predicted nucleotide-binding protein (sugar kinase/HSP70/actin superfamily)